MRPQVLLMISVGGFALLVAGCDDNSAPQALAPVSDQREEVQAALEGACVGQGSSLAADYAGGGIHPAVVLSSGSGAHDWSNDLPEAWAPQSVQDAQLVACVGEETERVIEECLYNGPSIFRYQYEVSVRLVEARTGAVVASTVLEGTLPRECRSTEDYDLTRLAGDHVSFAAARDWMQAYVEAAIGPASAAPAASGSLPSAEVSVFCGYFGESPATLQSGQPVVLSWKWGAASDDYLQDYVDAASFELRLDGDPLDASAASLSLEDCDDVRCAIWRLAPMVLEPGSHEAIMAVSLDREITDGFDLDGNGALDLYGPSVWEAPVCEIIVE